MQVTLEQIASVSPSGSLTRVLTAARDNQPIDYLDLLHTCGLEYTERHLPATPEYAKWFSKYAILSARMVQDYLPNPEFKKCLDNADHYLNGSISKDELLASISAELRKITSDHESTDTFFEYMKPENKIAIHACCAVHWACIATEDGSGWGVSAAALETRCAGKLLGKDFSKEQYKSLKALLRTNLTGENVCK